MSYVGISFGSYRAVLIDGAVFVQRSGRSVPVMALPSRIQFKILAWAIRNGYKRR